MAGEGGSITFISLRRVGEWAGTSPSLARAMNLRGPINFAVWS
jgi:hypothetical protein